MQIIVKFLEDDSGSVAIEYGLVAALVSLGIVGALNVMGPSLESLYERITDSIVAVMPAA